MGTRHWWSDRRAFALGAVAAAAVLLAGCGSSHDDAAGSGPSGTGGHSAHGSGSPAPSGSLQISADPGSSGKSGSGGTSSGGKSTGGKGSGSGSTAASGGGAVPASKRCRPGQLKATVRPLGAAAGTHHASIILTNTGGSCQSSGYVGLQLVSASNGKIATSVLHDTAQRPRTVTLKAHATMYAPASWGAVASSGESQTGNCEPAPHGLQVALPGASGTAHAAWSYGPVCGHGAITVGPLASGSGPAGG
ncbi:DUF4232 domain-containing protein [Actinocatenispora sera]|uniref:DUF4232 domain-containing protein n=1 Tax=Actinocatenispora sera TaxID=390989 RepID=A0A810L2S4_9ACTN|nr:DUF4232 domain-containing protein [Actinocatenispora sera]BCJ29754.1 hypothetical protein Asera_38620 [Actinocatenispora sera]